MKKLADISLFESLSSPSLVSCFNAEIPKRPRFPKSDYSGVSLIKTKLVPEADAVCQFFIDDCTPKIQQTYGFFMQFVDAWEKAVASLREYGKKKSRLNRYVKDVLGDTSMPPEISKWLNRNGSQKMNYYQTLGLLRKICLDSQAVIEEFSVMMPQSGLGKIKVGKHYGKVS